jgi:nucleoside-diphosphate-sugar epimerase
LKIIVTGAAGLLGTEICTQLKYDINNEVWAVDNHSRSTSIPPCDYFVSVDMRDPTSFESLPKDVDVIYHYSAINGTKNFYERPTEVLTNNFISDVNVFEWAKTLDKAPKVIYASTSEIVSDDPVVPVSEMKDVYIKDIHNARWSYRIAKIASENYLANTKAFPWVIVRYFNIYGRDSKAGHFIADQIAKISDGIYEVTGFDETRSFCYIEDAVKATIHVANATENEVVNVGNDTETPILEAVNIIARAMGQEGIEWKLKDGLAGSTKRRFPDIGRLRQLMPEYAPRSFEEGMKQIIPVKLDAETWKAFNELSK